MSDDLNADARAWVARRGASAFSSASAHARLARRAQSSSSAPRPAPAAPRTAASTGRAASQSCRHAWARGTSSARVEERRTWGHLWGLLCKAPTKHTRKTVTSLTMAAGHGRDNSRHPKVIEQLLATCPETVTPGTRRCPKVAKHYSNASHFTQANKTKSNTHLGERRTSSQIEEDKPAQQTRSSRSEAEERITTTTTNCHVADHGEDDPPRPSRSEASARTLNSPHGRRTCATRGSRRPSAQSHAQISDRPDSHSRRARSAACARALVEKNCSNNATCKMSFLSAQTQIRPIICQFCRCGPCSGQIRQTTDQLRLRSAHAGRCLFARLCEWGR